MKIYKIINCINNKIYVGKTSKTLNERFNIHLKNAKKKINRYLYDSINKYGVENFKIILLETCDETIVNNREKYWIEKLNTYYPNGYNMTIGGDGGFTLSSWSEEDRKKLYERQGNSRRGKRSESWKRSISEGAKIRESKKTDEIKKEISDKISTTLKKKYKNKELKVTVPSPKYGKDNWNYIDINIEEVLKLIKLEWKLIDIAKKFNTTPVTIGNKLRQNTGKRFIDWRRHYGITGPFSKVRQFDPD